MTLIRCRPLHPVRDMVSMQEEMDRLLDGVFGHGGARTCGVLPFTPRVDIEETAEEFVVRADLPGVSQQDVKIHLMGDILTIRGERRSESAAKDGNPLRRERACGAFERSFTLTSPVRADQVKATCRDGVLEIRIPKAEEARVREIEIKAG
ncbi:MAG: Hsp20/alpha crystallin family protein [Candidatus Eisenbacteria bacterium]|nr:Hsp20/alpha crystallin family protein [Candidatus Eisenbacteria bacterium]